MAKDTGYNLLKLRIMGVIKENYFFSSDHTEYS